MPQNTTAESDAYLRCLARLVRILIGGRFQEPADLWRLQTGLLDLQRDIQRSITELKQCPPSTDSLERLAALRRVRAHARRFGDAFAWIVLGLDRRIIDPLAQNEPVAVPPDDHGSKGMLAMAQGLAQAGLGFPLLHDITDCLRIGDVTFVSKNCEPITVEIKTRLVDERPTDDGHKTVEYQASVMSASEMPTLAFPEAPPPTKDSRSQVGLPVPRTARRLKRQLRRMETAHAHQRAKPDALEEIGGSPVLTSEVVLGYGDHVEELQRVARRARRIGAAWLPVDNTFMYGAIYDSNGIDPDRAPVFLEDLPDALAVSGLFFEERRERNSLVISTVPSEAGRGPQLYLPFFLLQLPKATILDLLHGRMLLLNLVNSGRLVEALEENGFSIRLPKGRNDLSPGSIVLSTTFESSDGNRYAAELHNIDFYVRQMMMEFKPLQYLIDMARAMRTRAISAHAERMSAA